MNFKDLTQLNENVLKSLEEMGFDKATPIQASTIESAMKGKDIIGQAQTGTGKTGAFGIPIINQVDSESKSIQHLIIAPTRELANQIYDQLKKIGKYSNLRIAIILGGISYDRQAKQLSEKPNVLVGTPGRINDYLLNKKIKLNELKTFTLDEADELLNIGFQKEIESIISYLPKQRQNFFFTATFNKKTKDLASKITDENNTENVSVSEGLVTATTIKQEMIIVKEGKKLSTLVKLLEFHKPKSVVIFGRTRRRVDELNEALNTLGFQSQAIQGDMQQRERNFAMDRFRNHQKSILVATDVMARGIDVDHIEWIVNFDLPQEIEYYTHRIGRAGRAGRAGYSISLVKSDEIEHMKEIEIKTNSKVKEIELPSDEELYQAWRNHTDMQLNNLLEQANQNEENPKYLENDLKSKFSHEDLSIILARFLLEKRGNESKVKLTPEPSIVLKGQAKVRNFRNRVNKFNSSSDGNRRHGGGRGRDNNFRRESGDRGGNGSGNGRGRKFESHPKAHGPKGPSHRKNFSHNK